MAIHPIAVHFGIVCDEVRREDSGKLFMIGVYGHDISVASFPARLALTLVISLLAKSPVDDHPLEVQTEFDGETIHSGRGLISINDAGINLIVLPGIVVPAAKAGELTFKAKAGAGRWKVMAKIPLQART